jgi:queuosine precursor transporter
MRRDDSTGSGSEGARTHFAAAQDESLYPVLVGVFVGLLLISNVAAVKLIVAGPFITDGGAFLFPLVYIAGDVLSEVYGWRAARKAILIGFGMAVLAAVTFLVVQVAPAADAWENQEAFEAILGFVPRIVLASVLGFLVGQLLNAYVLVRIKERTKERHLWVRLIGSTAVGELGDTLVFCTIAFYGVITGAEFLNYVIVGYGYKTLLEVVLLPITYRVIALVKRHEPSYDLPAALREM